MKITTLLETYTTPSTDPAGLQSQQAPKFGRDPHVLEDDEKLDETTAGAIATGEPTNMGMQRRAKGSMLQGIKTSKKFPNSEAVKEGHLYRPEQEDSPVSQAITRRILLQRTDLLSKYGPEKVGAAVDEVADFVGDVDEIGSSDVSGWVRHVEQMLSNIEQGVAEGSDNEPNLSKMSIDELKQHIEELTNSASEFFGVERSYINMDIAKAKAMLRRKLKQGVAEGEYDSRKPFGVRYKVFAGREGRVTTKEYWTTSSEKLEKAVAKIEALGNFYEIDGYSYPKEKQGVAEGLGLYGPFTVTINTGERPQSRTKTKKFRREDDAILWAQDWLEDAPQYVFATAEVTDSEGNVVWTTDEKGVSEGLNEYRVEINQDAPDDLYDIQDNLAMSRWKSSVKNVITSLFAKRYPGVQLFFKNTQEGNLFVTTDKSALASEDIDLYSDIDEFGASIIGPTAEYGVDDILYVGIGFDSIKSGKYKGIVGEMLNTIVPPLAAKFKAKPAIIIVVEDQSGGAWEAMANKLGWAFISGEDEQGVAEEKQRLDPKCWTGYKKQGTKMKGDTRVNNCVPVKEAEKYPEPEQEVIDATRRARLQREREPHGSEKINSMLAQRNAQLQQYNETGKFWIKKKDTQEHISDAYVGKAAANQAALHLLKQYPELKGNIVITAWGPGETPVNEAELSEEQLLARDLKKQLEVFKQAVNHDLSTKPNDKELGKKPKDKELKKK